MVISMITAIIFITLFTVAFGRVFCGWICPQTIFMEMVFRRIEYWIEGDRGKQIRLDKQKWDAEKIRKKGTKWFIFAVISRSEEHTSELQSRGHLVCRLLLEKKKTNK